MINNIGFDKELITRYNNNKSFLELKFCDRKLNTELVNFFKENYQT